MYISNDFGKVRIVHDGSPFDVAYDIRVEWLVDDEWVLYRGFNSLSDEYGSQHREDERLQKGNQYFDTINKYGKAHR